jgi:hypothetical protein
MVLFITRYTTLTLENPQKDLVFLVGFPDQFAFRLFCRRACFPIALRDLAIMTAEAGDLHIA